MSEGGLRNSGSLLQKLVFLDPAVSYQVAQQLAGTERITVSEQTLRQRLRQLGLLASIDAGRGMVQVHRTLEGARDRCSI